jgi:type I restriction-modification system DNA methylase subunit
VLKIPLYEGLESSFEDIIYQFFRRVLGERNYSVRIKRSGYPEIDSIIPSAASGRVGTGSCDAYVFNESNHTGFTGLIELESTGKLKDGIIQVRKYAKGFANKNLPENLSRITNSIKNRDLILIVFDGKEIYLSKLNLDTGKESVVINGESINTSNSDSINQALISMFPVTTHKKNRNEDELIKLTAKIIRGHEKLQRNKALIMTLLASIFGATNEVDYKRALESIKKSQSDYDVKLYQTYTEFLKEITDENDKEKIQSLYEQIAIYLYDLSKDQGMDLYGYIYEELASKENKKEQGEYYTPRHTIRPILKSIFDNNLKWDESELNEKIVLDPFCGSGGFLYEYVDIIKKKFSLSDQKIDKIAGESLWGFDKNGILGAYLNLFLAGDGSANIYRVKTSINWRKYFIYKDEKKKLNRLTDPKAIKFHLKQNLADINHHLKMLAGFDVQITEYDIDEYLDCDSPVDSFAMDKLGLTLGNKDERYLGNVDLLITNVPYGSVTEKREQFIESGSAIYGSSLEANALRECVDYLKPEIRKGKKTIQEGGVCIAIVPDSVLENPTAKPIRDYLISRCEIISIISLPPFTFAPYAMEKTYVLIFQKLAPEDFSYDREFNETFLYESICDGKANSVNRYETNHIQECEVRDFKGNKRLVNTYIHNDFDPFFDSIDSQSYSYLSKLEWAWKKDFSNLNPTWDQERVSEVWTKNGWKVLPGKKWGYMQLQRFQRNIQKEIQSKSLYEKINVYIEENSIDALDFSDDFIRYKELIKNEVKLSSAEEDKLERADSSTTEQESGIITLFESYQIEDVDLNPSSHRYLGVKKETYSLEEHIETISNSSYKNLDEIIKEFSHDFTSESLTPIRLGTEFDILQGTQFSKVDAYNYPGNVAVYTAATDGPAYYVDKNIPGKVMVSGPSLIWSRKGAKAGTIQKYDDVDSDGSYLPFFISDVSGTIKPKSDSADIYDLDFLLVYLAGLLRNERTSTANNAQLNKSKIENLKVYIPDLNTQKIIGDIVRKITGF